MIKTEEEKDKRKTLFSSFKLAFRRCEAVIVCFFSVAICILECTTTVGSKMLKITAQNRFPVSFGRSNYSNISCILSYVPEVTFHLANMIFLVILERNDRPQ
jgi:hypothetical protein